MAGKQDSEGLIIAGGLLIIFFCMAGSAVSGYDVFTVFIIGFISLVTGGFIAGVLVVIGVILVASYRQASLEQLNFHKEKVDLKSLRQDFSVFFVHFKRLAAETWAYLSETDAGIVAKHVSMEIKQIWGEFSERPVVKACIDVVTAVRDRALAIVKKFRQAKS